MNFPTFRAAAVAVALVATPLTVLLNVHYIYHL